MSRPPGRPSRPHVNGRQSAAKRTFQIFPGRFLSHFPEVALVKVAEANRELRKVKREQFGLEITEPAWNMLIELCFRDSTGASTTASQLKEVCNVPDSTADRWLGQLEQDNRIGITAHTTDAQTRFVDLKIKS